CHGPCQPRRHGTPPAPSTISTRMRTPAPGSARSYTPEITALAATKRHAAPCHGTTWHAVAPKVGTYTARSFRESSERPTFLGSIARDLVGSSPSRGAFDAAAAPRWRLFLRSLADLGGQRHEPPPPPARRSQSHPRAGHP